MRVASGAGTTSTSRFTLSVPPEGLLLECGKRLRPVTLAYETYGELNRKRDNAVLVLHSLSGNAHASGYGTPGASGWWDSMVGPGKAIDTRRYFVVSSNVLGGCHGSTGPCSVDPASGWPYGLSFPVVTIKDMVAAQKLLVEHLDIETLHAVVGPSMGGLQALQWSVSFPDSVRRVVVIASAARLSVKALALNNLVRNVITADPAWMDGDYYGRTLPWRGLSTARMISETVFSSEFLMERRFRRGPARSGGRGYTLDNDFEVERWLAEKGVQFVESFDANSYLYLTRAMDYFDLSYPHGSLKEALEGVQSKFLVVSLSSDTFFTPDQSEELVRALEEDGKDVSYTELHTPFGHDAFLTESAELGKLVSDFMEKRC